MQDKINLIVPNCMHHFLIKWAYYALCFTDVKLLAAVTMTNMEFSKGVAKNMTSLKSVFMVGLFTPAAGISSYYAAKSELSESLSRAGDLATKKIDEIAALNNDNFVFDYADIQSLIIEKGSSLKHTSIIVNVKGKEYRFAVETNNGMPHGLPDDILNGYINQITAILGDKCVIK
jgi:hypothetical protein